MTNKDTAIAAVAALVAIVVLINAVGPDTLFIGLGIVAVAVAVLGVIAALLSKRER